MTGLLEGKRIAVTGASRGIGRAIALTAAREGAAVAVLYRTRAEAAAEVAKTIEDDHGGTAVHLAFDHCEFDTIDLSVGAVADALGGLDAWVGCGSEVLEGLFVTSDAERLRRQLDVALVGPMLAARAAIERMMRPHDGRRGGVLLFIGSVAAARPARGQAAYAAAKGGIESLTRALAVEYAKKGIRALCLRPGAVDTDMLEATRALAESELEARIPLKRVATPEDVAEHAVFMLSDRASYATGSVVTVDGGYVIA